MGYLTLLLIDEIRDRNKHIKFVCEGLSVYSNDSTIYPAEILFRITSIRCNNGSPKSAESVNIILIVE